MAARKTIYLTVGGFRVKREATASGAISPGHIVERTSDSTPTVKVHATADGDIGVLNVAVEDQLQGRGVDDAYSSGDLVTYVVPKAGEKVQVIVANGQDISIGDEISSAGDGTVKKFAAQVDSSANAGAVTQAAIIGIADTAKDMSGSSAVDPDDAWLEMIVK